MKITFIGGGNMTAALIGGMARAKNPPDIAVIDRNPEKRRALRRRFGVAASASAAAEKGRRTAAEADMLILAVKPQDMRAACAAIPPGADIIISIAAGLSLRTIAGWLPFAPKNIARIMPNTPSAVAAGMSVCCGKISAKAKTQISAAFRAAGEVLWLKDESMLAAATAVSGSGPAYLYYFAEAMQESAVNLGFSAAEARFLVSQTLRGGGAMLAQSGESSSDLRRAVMSKGGTTERAIAALETGNLKKIVRQAMRACHARALEMEKIDAEKPPGGKR
ncbi:MAG: pyrroline-5-carboxylate reductase [Gammaproteobacteria bacterium]